MNMLDMAVPPGARTRRRSGTLTHMNLEYRGGWWLAVPLPFYGLLHITCRCGKRFWGFGSDKPYSFAYINYENHWRAEHAPESGPLQEEA